MNWQNVSVVGIVLLLLAAPIGGVAAQTATESATGVFASDTLTPAALDTPAETINRYGEPSWVVQLENDSDMSKLADWAGGDDRHLIDNATAGYAVVAASPSAIGTGLGARILGSGLAGEEYVVSIEPEVTVSRPARIRGQLRDNYEAPGGRFAQLRASLTNERTLDASAGLAFSGDFQPTHLGDSRTAMEADGVSATGAGQLVAVIDTGATVGEGRVFGNGSAGSDLRIHPDSKSFVTGETVDAAAGDYAAVDDEGGHGSHVAATIAADHSNASLDGVAPDAELLVLQALDPDSGSGDSHDIARAIRYAADRNADVIHMSLGAPTYNSEIAAAVRYAESEGSVVVVATGNSRARGIPWLASPADSGNATIAVNAATVADNASTARPAYFGQIGPDSGLDFSNGVTAGEEVTVVAPGTQITAPVLSDTDTQQLGTRTLTGTSMAAPHVSGAVAVLLEAEPSLQGNPSAVTERLTTTATRMPNATEAAVGAGYVSLGDAVANDETDETQAEAMTGAATARDAGVRSLSTGNSLWTSAGADVVGDDEEDS